MYVPTFARYTITISTCLRKATGLPTSPTTSLFAQSGHPPAGASAAASGSCLGLERDARCRQAGLDALTSGAATGEGLADALGRLWGQTVAVAPASALEPVAVLAAMMHPDDAALVSPAMALRHRRALDSAIAAGRDLAIAPADDQALLATLAERMAAGRRVWYVADTLDARSGKQAPLDALWALQDQAAGLHLLLDDTFGMGWCGANGRGLALGGAPREDRLVVLADLAHGLGAEIGVMASPDAGLVAAARPAGDACALGAFRIGVATAMADIASADWEVLQGRLQKRVQLADRLMRTHDLPRVGPGEAPLRYVDAHSPAVAFAVVGRLLEAGHAASATTVATPDGPRAAIRFALSLAQPLEALQGLLEELARALPDALEAAGTSLEALRRVHGGEGAAGPATMIDLASWRASRLSDSRGARSPG
jgi:7-keto-8-aminopelargonate synthetase-like enzyme